MYGPKQVSISEFFSAPLKYQELIRGYFNLNYMEFIVLCSINQLGVADTDEIRAHTDEGWPRNKINSALKKLVNLDLCTREKVIPEDQERGYKYVYTSVSADEIRSRLLAAFEQFVFSATKELDDLEYHLKSVDTKAYKRKKSKKERIRKQWFEDSNT